MEMLVRIIVITFCTLYLAATFIAAIIIIAKRGEEDD